MSFGLPFENRRIREARNKLIRLRTEEELDPWGATTVPRALRVWEPDIPTTGTPFVPETAPDFSMPQVGPEGIRAHEGIRGRSTLVPSAPSVPTPTPRPAERPRDVIQASDEVAFQQRVQADPVYDPLVQAGLETGGILESQAEINQRRET